MAATRRDVLINGLAFAAVGAISVPAVAKTTSYFAGTAVDNGVTYKTTNFDKIDPKWKKQVVKYFSEEPQGTVVVDTRHHFLYLIMENKTAIRYGVGVGREGFKWYGRATIDRKTLWPKWTPPPEMIKRHPELPAFVEGGSPKEPAHLARHVPAPRRRRPRLPHARHAGAVEHRHRRIERLHPHVHGIRDRPLSALPDRDGRASVAAYRRPGGQVEAAGGSDRRMRR